MNWAALCCAPPGSTASGRSRHGCATSMRCRGACCLPCYWNCVCAGSPPRCRTARRSTTWTSRSGLRPRWRRPSPVPGQNGRRAKQRGWTRRRWMTRPGPGLHSGSLRNPRRTDQPSSKSFIRTRGGSSGDGLDQPPQDARHESSQPQSARQRQSGPHRNLGQKLGERLKAQGMVPIGAPRSGSVVDSGVGHGSG
jgi:hypothetical protein